MYMTKNRSLGDAKFNLKGVYIILSTQADKELPNKYDLNQPCLDHLCHSIDATCQLNGVVIGVKDGRKMKKKFEPLCSLYSCMLGRRSYFMLKRAFYMQANRKPVKHASS